MCADYGHFADEIDNLENAGVTSFHIDIMDGIFVPNFALSWGQVAYCRTHTKLPLEAHLMVENIEPHINFILRKLFKNPCSQAELNKIVPFGFSLQRQKMVFFCHQNSIILLC